MNLKTAIRTPSDAHLTAHEQRQAHILARLNAEGFQAISDLAQAFQVSAQTLRRDVNALAEQGLCRRSHGGIWPMGHALKNVDYPERRSMGLDAKQRIAELVAQQVPDGASLFLGIGTTLEVCAAALAHKTGLRVMSNNLNAVAALARNPDTHIRIPGGRVRNLDLDIVSAEAHGFFGRYAVDIGIFGVGGISPDGELLDFHEDEALMRHTLSQNCRRRFLAFDHSKFDRRATVRQGHITEVDGIFTDRVPPQGILDMVRDAGIALFLPPAATVAPVATPAPSSSPLFPTETSR